METSHQPDQAQRFFQYLKEFTKLKYKPQRTNQGDGVLWLHALPEDPRITNVARQSAEAAGDDWLVIQKPRFLPAPALPDELAGWVTGAVDRPDQAPSIRSQRVVAAQVLDDDLQTRDIKETLFLDQEEAVLKSWQAYEQRWQAWAEEERRARDVQRHYSQLFDFHQKLAAESEKYELRLGLGHLTWRAPSSGEVRRHLFTARAALHFDALRGVLSVTAAGDGARTALEQDMLDADDRVMAQVQEAIQKVLLDNGEDLWSGQTLPALLETWVNSAGDRGTYAAELRPVQGVSERPAVHWAPALILRRRGERTLTAAYDSILTQLSAPAGLPDSVRRFLGDRPPVSGPAEPGQQDQTVYFPLPANNAQRDIIQRIRREEGVLVQGPPGTGKSHTIVNLVSHLLATDQKVLVTSHTARALSVLREKFPVELRNLCITHLRGEEGAQAALQGSVGEILHRFTSRQPGQEAEQEKLLFSLLTQARQQEDCLLDSLREIREAETGQLDLFGYRGPAQLVGAQLRAQEPQFEWLADLADPTRTAPLTTAEMGRLLELLRDLSAEEAQELSLRQPEAAELTRPEAFLRFVQGEKASKEQAAAHEAARGHPLYPVVERAGPEARHALLQTVQALMASVDTERQRPLPWLAGAVDATLKEQASRWQEVARQSLELLPELHQHADELEERALTGLNGRDLPALRSDAQAVLDHLRGGGNWGGLFGKPAAVKQRQYLRTEVRLGGRAADTVETLTALLNHLRLDANLDKLKALWASLGVEVSGPVRLQVTELGAHCQALVRVLKLRQALEAAQQAVQGIMGLPQPQWWEAGDLRALVAMVQAADAGSEAQASRQTLEALLPSLQGLKAAGNAHGIVSELIGAIEGRDDEAYGLAYLSLQALAQRQALLSEQRALLSRLRAGASLLTDELLSTFPEPTWDARLAAFEQAWNWVRADLRVRELANPDTEVDTREQLAAARDVQRRTLGQLAATKAWRSTLDRMTPREQAALVRWQNAIRRIGRGTGKNAGKWRQVAQQSLDEARTAIPAWIMPLHLVAENFAVSPGMFDVVIVDEASQAGPESLFLTFIAKKIIIVGDDKQIEPEGVGIPIAQVDALVQRYLRDVPAPEVIGDPKASLFGFGSYAYPTRISLREHFRCMPEIIKFSSDLSYPQEPLIALRQFGAERLQPLVARQVEGGYTMPLRGDKFNPVEARAIVDQIKACIANPRYAGKSFGVISLVGESQAEEIATLLRAEIGEAELEARRLVCGNAYSFQGDERDVIFLSMVVSPTDGKREGKVGRDSDKFQPRYNVAVSRARDQLWLFHSLDLTDLHPEDLRASLIRHVRKPELEGWTPLASKEILTLRELAARPGRGNTPPPGKFDSWFEVDVYLDLVDRGYRVIPQYELGGYRIDLVVEGLRGRLAVECDGDHWHGPEKYLDDLARQQTLERAGMEFWRVRGSTYARDPEGALEDLWRTLEKRGVFPEGDPRNFQPTGPLPAGGPAEPIEGPVDAAAALQAEEAAQEEIVETTSELITPVDHAVTTLLEPYGRWVSRPLPDPRTLSSLEPVVEGLQEIVGSEGPMTARQAYQMYCQSAGIRLGQATKSLLNKAMTRALRTQVLLASDEWGTPGLLDKIVRTPLSPAVRLRETGPRKLMDVPPSEIQALMLKLIASEPDLGEGSPEALYRIVLATYGAQRLTENVRSLLDRAAALPVQEGAGRPGATALTRESSL
ncbi:AAA domain-containing protein [Deinococcus soli (ex Cha et al. 2016)]|uniref:Very-short-patch-repair endonuclease n=2 Tax=Deinococcus soli (ex Cha et al. 2016) TaxID=1309411 RepID=A0ACC6KJS5_9DEIO|nr:AAA domain-containing protein [Deinococcus soli (ex Cha et al. 2016)]MDR6219844.1 very-short-patch-repair endonuclease [Deinococcus soli (ex Cha et al. 2016)]MDR6329898.1 very-short-patch-repair endonuclease [Deinococcus soli (ex Cha et al. 2016)]MDR6752751.1 very-short-patch-repair endonuclease [Deinococcus soli (ex Cha et al. 2016)]